MRPPKASERCRGAISRKSRFSEPQIVHILRPADVGETTIGQLCRDHGISEHLLPLATPLRWHGNPRTAATATPRAENARLKRLLAERDLEVDAPKELLVKKVATLADRREAVAFLRGRGISERRACRLLHIGWSTLRHRQRVDQDEALRQRLRDLAQRPPRYGYRRAWAVLRREGITPPPASWPRDPGDHGPRPPSPMIFDDTRPAGPGFPQEMDRSGDVPPGSGARVHRTSPRVPG